VKRSEREGVPLDQPIHPGESFSALLRIRGGEPRWDLPDNATGLTVTEGTTVLAFRYAGGVVMAGDRRATAGSQIAHRRVQKVFAADGYSAVAIAGTAGIAIELIRLFQTELEHYEKMEGSRLSLDGKANYLAAMLRRNLPMAFQGLVVIPLFCGFEPADDRARLYSFDVVGGRYEEIDYAATGSGGRDAHMYLRSSFQPDLAEEDAVRLAIAALVVAAEEDSATGGPDLRRDIYPNVVVVDGNGYREIEEDLVAETSRSVMETTP
jgi:proteasome beta subunit